MTYKDIDYTKLNERIVEQAYLNVQRFEMTKEQTDKLINDKFERAKMYSQALQKSPVAY